MQSIKDVPERQEVKAGFFLNQIIYVMSDKDGYLYMAAAAVWLPLFNLVARTTDTIPESTLDNWISAFQLSV